MKKVRIRPIADQFNYEVFWSVPDQEYVAIIEGVGSLSWISPSERRSVKGLKRMIQECIDWSIKEGEYFEYPHQMPKHSRVTRKPPLLEFDTDIEAEFVDLLEEIDRRKELGLPTYHEEFVARHEDQDLKRAL